MKKKFLLFGLLISFLLNIDIVSATEYVKCGDITGIPSGLPAFSRNIVNLIKFVIPIVLCILGMLDFAKAVMAGDEKAMSEGPKKFIKRVIAAVLVFFVVSIVQFIFNILGNSDPDQEYINNENFNSCLKCFISDESGCSEDTEKIQDDNTNNTNNNTSNNTNNNTSNNTNNNTSNNTNNNTSSNPNSSTHQSSSGATHGGAGGKF